MRAPSLAFAVLALAACARRSPGEAAPAPTASTTTPSVSTAAPDPAPPRPARRDRPEPPEGYVSARVLDVMQVHHTDVVLLVDAANERVLPIFVGGTEALSIRLRHESQRFQRPLTHDLLDNLVKRLGGELAKVHVDELRGTTYVGRVFVWQGDRMIDVDARPSDAIALALGNGAPIFVARRVLDATGLRKKDLDDPDRRLIEVLPRAKEPMAL